MKVSMITALTAFALSGVAVAQEKKEEKKEPTGHCEKLEADGKTVDVEAKDKADCKAKGGKWNKVGKDDHDHEKK